MSRVAQSAMKLLKQTQFAVPDFHGLPDGTTIHYAPAPASLVGLLSKADLNIAQQLVTEWHYLRRPVDVRCSPMAYDITVKPHALWGDDVRTAGVLIFGRPEATRCRDFYGSVADVQREKCEVTRWQVLNLARVFIYPECQPGGALSKKGKEFGLRELQGYVGGNIELLDIGESMMVLNEEGKLDGSPLNEEATLIARPYLFTFDEGIGGDVLICQFDEIS